MIFTCGIAVGADAPAGADSTGGSVGGITGSLDCAIFVFDGVANRFHNPSVVTIATVAIAVCTSFHLRELGLVAMLILSRRVLDHHDFHRYHWYCCYCFYLYVGLLEQKRVHSLRPAPPVYLKSVHPDPRKQHRYS
jgi:hypothetical protein